MTVTLQPGDLVESSDEAARQVIPPLVVREALCAFLDQQDLGEGPLEVERIGDGHSIETFMLRRGDRRMVMRRPPRPPFAPGAHDVLREARVLKALEGRGVRAPRLLAVCADESVIGAPFTVTDFLDGVVITAELPAPFAEPGESRRVGEELIDALVEFHGIVPADAGLESLGAPGPFLPRQTARFRRLWERDPVREVPMIEEVASWLEQEMPQPAPARLTHSDFRLGNMMFAPQLPARLIAILDWETTTIGDPLIDLGYLLGTYPERGEELNALSRLSAVVAQPGFPTRNELARRYGERSGRSLERLRWYAVFAVWKVAIILEGSYRRFRRGSADDAFFAELETGVPDLAARAAELIEAEEDWLALG